MSKILVTGSLGFIGRQLVASLREDGAEVLEMDIAFDINNKNHVDIVSIEEVDSYFQLNRPDKVVHLAAQTKVLESIADPRFDLNVNATGTLNLLISANRYGASNFTYIHSGGAVYKSNQPLPLSEESFELPESPYGLSKNMAEGYVRIYSKLNNMDWSSLALSNCFGPYEKQGKGVINDWLTDLILDREPIINGAHITRDFIYIDDVIVAIKLALDRPTFGRVNISSNSETSLAALYKLICEIWGTFRDPIILNPKFGEVTQSRLLNLKAREKLGWEPRIDLSQGLQRIISEIRKK